VLFPFAAVVDQEQVKRALLLNAVNPRIGGVLISGPSGTAKSTLVRGLVEVLPEIEVVEGCRFSCHPRGEGGYCPECQERAAAGSLPAVRRPVRLVNLPLNATEDRVAGTLDLGRALRQGELAFHPGLLALAHRGILYVDEINLLDDHLVDILLDAAALGVNYVEREGVSFTHPARFILVGTMNPEEGELRPQIADRIGLHVDAEILTDLETRKQVLERWEQFWAQPAAFRRQFAPATARLREAVRRGRELLPQVRVPEGLKYAISRLTVRLGVVSHRADIALAECALAAAALEGRLVVTSEDLLSVAPLVLSHRLKRQPLSITAEMDASDIHRTLEDILHEEPSRTQKKTDRGSRRHACPTPE